MTMKQQNAKRKKSGIAEGILLEYEMPARIRRIAMGAIALLCIAAGLLYIFPMRSTLGVLGFPLDDSWIPLTFARNLHSFGSYSYFQREMVTSGSTSPLYVFLLAGCAFFTSDPFLPAFAIGIASFAAAAIFVFRLGLVLFRREQWLAAVAALAFILMPKMQSAAVSGMSTMLFTALVTASAYYYFARRSAAFLVLAALALWVRPDALIFLLAAVVHLVFHHGGLKEKTPAVPGDAPVSKRTAMIGGAAALIVILAYVAFNLSLSGTLFPNSVGAKLAYYKGLEGPSYSGAVFGYYLHGVTAVLFPPALVTIVAALIDLARRRAQPFVMATLFVLGTVAAYGIFLPFLYDDARYLAPTMPFIAMLGVAGVRIVFAWLSLLFPFGAVGKALNGVSMAVLAVALLLGLTSWSGTRKDHFLAVKYQQERPVAAAAWIAAQTPASAIVATHTIGALGYHGGRMLIDITGIVTPALLPTIGNLKDLEIFLKAQRTTHIATLRERFEVVNMNPVFTSDPRTPEVMEVIPYKPGQTHILTQRAAALNAQAAAFMQRNMNQQAVELLRRSYALDPMSARTSTLAGLGLLAMQDTAQAISFLDQSLLIQPDYAPAMVPMADVYINRKDYKTAVTLLRKALELNPRSSIAARSYEKAYKYYYIDSMRTAGWQSLAPVSR
jgi:hypothetical protein